MTGKEYVIVVHSTWRFLFMFITILSFIGLAISMLIGHETLSILISVVEGIVTIIVSFYLAEKLSRARVKITLNRDFYEHLWLKNFVFASEKGVRIHWNAINDYIFFDDRAFYGFTLNLDGQRQYNINRLKLIKYNDDFQRFRVDFSTMSDYNSKRGGKSIVRGKSIYEQKSFRMIVYCLGIIFLTLVAVKIIVPEQGIPWTSLGVVGSMFFFYSWMMYSTKQKN